MRHTVAIVALLLAASTAAHAQQLMVGGAVYQTFGAAPTAPTETPLGDRRRRHPAWRGSVRSRGHARVAAAQPMIALDTNLLVYAHRSRTPAHRSSRRAIERAAAAGRWGLALASVAEFWAVATHPASPGRPSTPREAAAYLQSLVDAGAEILEPGAGFGSRLAQLAVDVERFVKLPGLRLHNPLAAG
jgi:predicted nucleic acid-binding protein